MLLLHYRFIFSASEARGNAPRFQFVLRDEDVNPGLRLGLGTEIRCTAVPALLQVYLFRFVFGVRQKRRVKEGGQGLPSAHLSPRMRSLFPPCSPVRKYLHLPLGILTFQRSFVFANLSTSDYCRGRYCSEYYSLTSLDCLTNCTLDLHTSVIEPMKIVSFPVLEATCQITALLPQNC